MTPITGYQGFPHNRAGPHRWALRESCPAPSTRPPPFLGLQQHIDAGAAVEDRTEVGVDQAFGWKAWVEWHCRFRPDSRARWSRKSKLWHEEGRQRGSDNRYRGTDRMTQRGGEHVILGTVGLITRPGAGARQGSGPAGRSKPPGVPIRSTSSGPRAASKRFPTTSEGK